MKAASVPQPDSATFIKHKGHRRHVADELGISERTLYRKLKEYGLCEIGQL